MIHLCPIWGGRLSDRGRGQVYPYMYMSDPNRDKFTSMALNRKHNVGFLKVKNEGDRGDVGGAHLVVKSGGTPSL